MAKTFFPEDYVKVKATRKNITKEIEYKVSVGMEEWSDGSHRRVYKVQMVIDGKVNGRQAPSFPAETDDLERVYKALLYLKKRHGDA
ncbi:hypothetical protein MOF13_14680 [Bacillus spizizenii]|uniref:hypothetical protein n=1 Tax=Bacillus inaquosorum TaxID=483913 RepID=UPI00227F8154|nr:hypothetical protein [Bacillus inaquosorum]MCY7839980.1 hypothetical protein [Bacillus spizizenii]MCY7880244.1 hypothetical protein [Bacillus spizizenii]MCY8325372.1 hypothetical protein [Bacillus spizizenii]MCY8375458.1 hypothetical protein [Bacillus inaquosorum]MCY9260334.1 hypothetical protein [Bacillus spizizenii]